ncbi:uncharacterized protein CC84DRAFT_1084288 [Paraphaeosphaeria sporulosa]|uniref:G protein-coupled glucose receptor regulating Gpa2-domain-containing protein n=1 Tax=Paraphaeosphaeria sporulosa TaxID=1460663 RepID=A0A177CTB2_9PLEO|nr:uncharacterized protein CC84DRAFT_1084288 [Paraphaeosphaeria sporulosa]OAG10152.1 hypothetical protein CC84DRAFT_1084288 [Paraphaeosphaeria sporulosa]
MLFTAGSLFTKAISSPLPNVAHYYGPSYSKLYDDQKNYNVRVASAACAATSMVAAFTVFYWFCRMEKRFRHRLIMLLIFGDLMKALWLFLQAVVSLARGTIITESAFCQSSGFFVQFGTEESDRIADFAVLCIALHSALQVFRPSNTVHSDGLYPHRHYVYAGSLLIPAMMAALAFINPRWGYMSQGPYCSLPLRPFWYRLALQWIPRYLIAIIILGLAIAIYAHVGFEFRALSNSVKETKPSISTTTPIFSVGSPEDGSANGPEMSQYQVSHFGRDSSVVSMVGQSRRASGVASVDSHTNTASDTAHGSSIPGSPHTVDHWYMLPQLQTYDTANTANAPSVEKGNKPPRNISGDNSDGNTSPFSDAPSQHLQRQLAQKRARIHRQLRLMFIYPIVYVLVWLVPFINHCLTYQDHFAAHPLYWLSMINVICVTSMGAIDCLIFSLRERPWRHIPSSDGSFLGSLVWWRRSPPSNGALVSSRARPSDVLYHVNTEANPDTPHVRTEQGWRDSMMRAGRNVGTHSRTSGSSSDRAKAQAVMARSRLELEKDDRRVARVMDRGEDASRTPRARRGTALTGLETIESPEEETRVELGAEENDGSGDAEGC